LAYQSPVRRRTAYHLHWVGVDFTNTCCCSCWRRVACCCPPATCCSRVCSAFSVTWHSFSVRLRQCHSIRWPTGAASSAFQLGPFSTLLSPARPTTRRACSAQVRSTSITIPISILSSLCTARRTAAVVIRKCLARRLQTK